MLTSAPSGTRRSLPILKKSASMASLSGYEYLHQPLSKDSGFDYHHQPLSRPFQPPALSPDNPFSRNRATTTQPTTPFSSNSSLGVCRYFLQGFCSRGEKCFYDHISIPHTRNRSVPVPVSLSNFGPHHSSVSLFTTSPSQSQSHILEPSATNFTYPAATSHASPVTGSGPLLAIDPTLYRGQQSHKSFEEEGNLQVSYRSSLRVCKSARASWSVLSALQRSIRL